MPIEHWDNDDWPETDLAQLMKLQILILTYLLFKYNSKSVTLEYSLYYCSAFVLNKLISMYNVNG